LAARATLDAAITAHLNTYALALHQKAIAARGHFSRSLVAVHDENGRLCLAQDEAPHADASLETLAGLKASFAAMGGAGFG
jgi:acetyl-CoA C-acetyltransferase